MKQKTKLETIIGWVFGIGIALAFLCGIAIVISWSWKFIYELLMY